MVDSRSTALANPPRRRLAAPTTRLLDAPYYGVVRNTPPPCDRSHRCRSLLPESNGRRLETLGTSPKSGARPLAQATAHLRESAAMPSGSTNYLEIYHRKSILFPETNTTTPYYHRITNGHGIFTNAIAECYRRGKIRLIKNVLNRVEAPSIGDNPGVGDAPEVDY